MPYNADNERTKFNGMRRSGACPPRKRRAGLNPAQELDGANPPNVTANLLTGLGIGEYFTRSDASGTMAFMTDALGSTVGLVNSAGGIDTSYTYQPFGATTVSGTSANPYQFTGRENDATGLHFNRARYYSPAFQRFIAQDPIGFAGGDTNLYAYVWSDPTNFIDPPGLLGFGGTLGGEGGGGLGAVAAGGTAAVGGGWFSSGGFGAFATTGTFGFGPNGPSANPPCPGSSGSSFGGFAGAGIGPFITNASDVSQLSGPFRTYSINLGAGLGGFGVQFSYGYDSAGDLIGVLGATVFGPGFGVNASAFNTNTTTTGGGGGGGGCPCQ
jgi:RHS repeat-associated protein